MRPDPQGGDAMTTEAQIDQRLRAALMAAAAGGRTVTYGALAQALGLSPPNTIAQVTASLERLMAEDSAAGRPLLSAVAVGRARGGLPGRGFFEAAAALGRFDPAAETEAAFHAREIAALRALPPAPEG